METIQCIETRRSVRKYQDKEIPNEVMERLIELGTKAATGSNMQPWGFLTIQGKDVIQEISEEIKKELRENLEQYPHLAQYKDWFYNPDFSIFNHASDLLMIYGNTNTYYYKEDGSLAAANIMLAAHDMGIGSCWIGFAEYHMNSREFKEKYHVPEEYALVCTMSLGYEVHELKPPKRKPPVRFGLSL